MTRKGVRGMEATAKALLEHWSWAAESGVMNSNAAGSLRAACLKVLSIYDDLESVDIRQLDIEDCLRRFENLKKKEFKPDRLEAYKQRFRQAHRSYLEFLEDPSGWRPSGWPRPAHAAEKSRLRRNPTRSSRRGGSRT